MADIILTLPASVDARTVAGIFGPSESGNEGWGNCYFTLGRGKPQQAVDRIWWTWRGRILGSFKVARIVVNDGSLPSLCRIDGEGGPWVPKPDRHIAITVGDCVPLRERLYMGGFRGWRYFDIDAYRQTAESRMRL